MHAQSFFSPVKKGKDKVHVSSSLISVEKNDLEVMYKYVY